MKFDATKVFLFLSLLLNALGGSGLVSPVIAPEPAAPCPPAVAAPAADAGASR